MSKTLQGKKLSDEHFDDDNLDMEEDFEDDESDELDEDEDESEQEMSGMPGEVGPDHFEDAAKGFLASYRAPTPSGSGAEFLDLFHGLIAGGLDPKSAVDAAKDVFLAILQHKAKG